MPKKLSKTEALEEIEEFFKKIESKNPKEIKKIKRLAMKYNLPLKEKRKRFCKKCLAPYRNPKIRIKNKMKIIECGECKYVGRWKL